MTELERVTRERDVLESMPVCPFCKEQMSIVRYDGFYESFGYWKCGCDEDELGVKSTHQWRGSYA